jgi:uncharacterized protein YjbI with pentapeptide repeats
MQIGSAVLGAAGLAVIIWILPSFLTRHPHIASASDRHEAISDTRTGLIAVVVAAGAAGGLAYTARTYRLSQQGQFTDRYSKAIEQLGENKMEVRLGGIYALERLMADKARDQPTILEVLAASVRERTSVTPAPEKIATDVQAALTVIGRRTPVRSESPIDLSGAHLDGANLTEAPLNDATLTDTHLDNAYLLHAQLQGAYFAAASLKGARPGMANLQDAHLIDADHLGATLTGAQLQSAGLSRANLFGAKLTGANLAGARHIAANLLGADLTDTNLAAADLTEANLQRAILFDARLNRADLARADLTDAQGLLKSQIDVTFGDKDTKLPEGLRRPPSWAG